MIANPQVAAMIQQQEKEEEKKDEEYTQTISQFTIKKAPTKKQVMRWIRDPLQVQNDLEKEKVPSLTPVFRPCMASSTFLFEME